MDRISEQLQQLAASLRPTQEELSRMQEAFGAVQQLLMQHFPQCKVCFGYLGCQLAAQQISAWRCLLQGCTEEPQEKNQRRMNDEALC
jgi:hypothetical protein